MSLERRLERLEGKLPQRQQEPRAEPRRPRLDLSLLSFDTKKSILAAIRRVKAGLQQFLADPNSLTVEGKQKLLAAVRRLKAGEGFPYSDLALPQEAKATCGERVHLTQRVRRVR
jgi:hypothetical protein